jgi:hypothetical protein
MGRAAPQWEVEDFPASCALASGQSFRVVARPLRAALLAAQLQE